MDECMEVVMNRKPVVPSALLVGLLLAGCATYPPEYYDRGDPNYHRGSHYGAYHDGGRVCANCGEVADVDRVYLRDRTSGLGAVIGAIAGGVLGSTVGHGDGRTAATVAGAVAGGVAGNAIERHGDRGGEAAWQFGVRLDDGRYATVTQFENPGFRPGDRVVIRNDRLHWSRR
jgi:outer membrane lipoprotein SlyB